MFTLLWEDSVTSSPKTNALCLSLIIHITAGLMITALPLISVPPVRLKLTTINAGSLEPVRTPRLIYAPTLRRPDFTSTSPDFTKAARLKEQPSSIRAGDSEHSDSQTDIPSDLLRMLDTNVGTEPGRMVTLANIVTLSPAVPSTDGSIPPPPEPPPGNSDVRPPIVASHLEPAVLVEQTKPAYPDLAKTARVDGIVILEGIVNIRGHVENLRVVSGHPMLVDAAIKAVEKWKYRPAKMNGHFVPQPMRVQVRFMLEYSQ